MNRKTVIELENHITKSLLEAGANQLMAEKTAYFLAKAESQGLSSHGFSRLAQYTAHLKNGRANGAANPKIISDRGACTLIDAGDGLAYSACEMAINELVKKTQEFGIALAGVTNSHHFGAAALHLEQLAQAGFIGLAFSNSPAAMPAWGGSKPIFGTNPIAAVFPRKNADPIIIDLALSQVARGKLMVAARKGEKIPLGWALDSDGKPTDDPKKGMHGLMCPAGGVKGAMLAFIVETLCVGLTNSALSFEADSFFTDNGNKPRLGHCFIGINPGAMAGNNAYNERLEALIMMMLEDDTVRLPGASRRKAQKMAESEGIAIAI